MFVTVMKEENNSQIIQTLSRGWKMQGNGYCPGASREEPSPDNTLILVQ